MPERSRLQSSRRCCVAPTGGCQWLLVRTMIVVDLWFKHMPCAPLTLVLFFSFLFSVPFVLSFCSSSPNINTFTGARPQTLPCSVIVVKGIPVQTVMPLRWNVAARWVNAATVPNWTRRVLCLTIPTSNVWTGTAVLYAWSVHRDMWNKARCVWTAQEGPVWEMPFCFLLLFPLPYLLVYLVSFFSPKYASKMLKREMVILGKLKSSWPLFRYWVQCQACLTM